MDAWANEAERQDCILQDAAEIARKEAARAACGGGNGCGPGNAASSSSAAEVDGLVRLDPYIWQPPPPGTTVVRADMNIVATDENGGLVCGCMRSALSPDEVRSHASTLKQLLAFHTCHGRAPGKDLTVANELAHIRFGAGSDYASPHVMQFEQANGK